MGLVFVESKLRWVGLNYVLWFWRLKIVYRRCVES